MFKKNTAVIGFKIGLISKTDNSDITTGTPVGYYTIDDGSQSAIADVTPVHKGNGEWTFDLTAGEKERGTLETILTVPIKRSELLLGKYLTVTTVALITGTLNLVSMLMTYSLGLIQLGDMNGSINFDFSLSAILILFVLLIPLSMFISASILSVCLFGRSFKEAQNLATPFYLLLIFPSLFAMAPGINFS